MHLHLITLRHTAVHECIHTYIHTCIYICMDEYYGSANTYARANCFYQDALFLSAKVYVYVYLHVYAYVTHTQNIHRYICIHTHIYNIFYIHMHTHTHTHTHTKQTSIRPRSARNLATTATVARVCSALTVLFLPIRNTASAQTVISAWNAFWQAVTFAFGRLICGIIRVVICVYHVRFWKTCMWYDTCGYLCVLRALVFRVCMHGEIH